MKSVYLSPVKNMWPVVLYINIASISVHQKGTYFFTLLVRPLSAHYIRLWDMINLKIWHHAHFITFTWSGEDRCWIQNTRLKFITNNYSGYRDEKSTQIFWNSYTGGILIKRCKDECFDQLGNCRSFPSCTVCTFNSIFGQSIIEALCHNLISLNIQYLALVPNTILSEIMIVWY